MSLFAAPSNYVFHVSKNFSGQRKTKAHIDCLLVRDELESVDGCGAGEREKERRKHLIRVSDSKRKLRVRGFSDA